MMGQHTRSESLFYYFKLDDYVPKNHLLRLIDEHVSFGGWPTLALLPNRHGVPRSSLGLARAGHFSVVMSNHIHRFQL